MFRFSDAIKKMVEKKAQSMIAGGESRAPLKSPDGKALLYLSTERDGLRTVFGEIDVDGTAVYAGLPTKN